MKQQITYIYIFVRSHIYIFVSENVLVIATQKLKYYDHFIKAFSLFIYLHKDK